METLTLSDVQKCKRLWDKLLKSHQDLDAAIRARGDSPQIRDLYREFQEFKLSSQRKIGNLLI